MNRFSKKISTAYLTKIAILVAISFVLYAFCKFNLPFMFPSFLEMQISDLPAIIGGFALGPISGTVIIVIKCCLKMAMTSTGCVGELVDIVVGVSFVLTATLIYKRKKDKKHAVIGLVAGSLVSIVAAMIMNYAVAVPFYVEVMFGGNWGPILGMCQTLYPSVTVDNFYVFYLFLGVLPFNALRLLIVSVLTFLLYKQLSVILKKEFDSTINSFDKTKAEQVLYVKNLKGTARIARQMARCLKDKDVIILRGDLGAGKTTFTSYLVKNLGVKESVTSPTFTVLNQYKGKKYVVNHLDMYRIESFDELYETGVAETISEGGITVVEWNKLDDIEREAIFVTITGAGSKRKFEIKLPESFLNRYVKTKKSEDKAFLVSPEMQNPDEGQDGCCVSDNNATDETAKKNTEAPKSDMTKSGSDNTSVDEKGGSAKKVKQAV